MGSVMNKSSNVPAKTPQKYVIQSKRIEDPRSPTEEIARTPIEVADKFPKDTDSRKLRETFQFPDSKDINDADYSSPQIRKTDGKDLQKLRKPLVALIGNEKDDFKPSGGSCQTDLLKEKEN